MFNGSNVFTVPQQIPGFGGKQIPLDLGGGGPGLVVYFPGAKTLFVTATEATIPVPAISKDTKLKWVATLSDKSMQLGLGNSIPIGGNASNVFFWNVRLNATDLARGATASLRGENKGKEIMLGTLNAGLLHKPSCVNKNNQSHVSDLVAGTGFQAQVVAKDGQIMVKHGTVLLPLAVWEASMVALSTTINRGTNLACDGQSVVQRARSVLEGAKNELRHFLNPEEIAAWSLGIGAVIFGAALEMLKPEWLKSTSGS
jgi:hypothetical protein